MIRIIQLMIHYHVVTPQLLSSWPFHAQAVAAIQRRYSINCEASLFITYESILKLTYHRDGQLPNDGIQVHYLIDCEQPDVIQDFGCSRRLLYLLGCINLHESTTRDDLDARRAAGQLILNQCTRIIQVAPEKKEANRALIEKTAESYELTAKLMVYSRLFGYDRCPRVCG